MNFALLTASSLAEPATSDPNVLMVVGIGVGTVFVGLLALVAVCWLLGNIVKLIEKPQAKIEEVPTALVTDNDLFNTDRGTFIAAVSAAIAEQSGTDATGIRIVSVKKL